MAAIFPASAVSVMAVLCTCAIVAASLDQDRRLELAGANNRFALDLYRTLAAEPGRDNVFFSPLSVSMALAMTSLGARGDTAGQIGAVLRFDRWEESRLAHSAGADLHSAGADIHSAVADFHSAVFGAGPGPSSGSGSHVLRRTNRLFARQGLDLRREFLADAERLYGSQAAAAPAASLDFAGDAEGARRFINAWVGRETAGKIPDLLPPGSVSGDTQLVLANAVYFKADWHRRFDASRTSDGDFLVSESGRAVRVPMMRRKSKFGFAQDLELKCKVLELPYAGGGFSMVVVLPERVGGLEALRSRLTEEKLRHLLDNLSNVTVDVALPRFRLEETYRLNDALHGMGLRDLFVPGTADLSGLAGSAAGLHVSSVVHRAFLEVTEEGSEAAAASAVTVSRRSVSLTPEFVADHPFLFLIADSGTKAIVFMGHLRKPDGAGPNHMEL